MKDTPPHQGRLVIVSNRLPFSMTRTAAGKYDFSETTGGLVTGLASYLASLGPDTKNGEPYLWVGWPGATIEPEAKRAIAERARAQHHSVPVFLSESDMDRFYMGFCNRTLWPLFHSFPTFASFDESTWETYRNVNKQFCDTLIDILKPGDAVWIHDYHLMLLPRLVKEKLPSLRIGFFLHIPFPAYEMFQLLPSEWRRDLLEGLLGSDVVGFHTYEYTQHFLQGVLRILGHGHNFGQILLPDRSVRAGTFPMGIDFERFSTMASSPAVQAEVTRLQSILGDVRTILSADRLDYTKGILNRLQGFDQFLEGNPQWHGKVVLLLVVVPSRVGVDQYDQMKRQLEELVGRINGKYGRIGWEPVVYQYRYVPFEPLVALYATSDVAMVTPLRDGMNLVAKEYVAARTGGTGVLILSEMAGAAKELGEAVLVNPNHCAEIATAIGKALSIPVEDQSRALHVMQGRLQRSTVFRWANEFVRTLAMPGEHQKRKETRSFSNTARRRVHDEYRKSRRRLLLLDYDGTLVTFVTDFATARPGRKVLSLIHDLTEDKSNDVVIVSGRDRKTLQEWFKGFRIHLVAEHGFFSKKAGGEWRTLKIIPTDWKEHLMPMLQRFADRLPGAKVEEKDFSLVWHYRAADSEQGEPFAHELVDNLNALTGNVDVQVMRANKAIEIRVSGVNKGTIASELLDEGEYDFVLAIGDDTTDEDLFAALPKAAHSIKVGNGLSTARYHCRDVNDVHDLLSVFTGQNLHPRGFLQRILDTISRVTRDFEPG
jgi:trehalose 6-phosphate synthase/phosphatase